MVNAGVLIPISLQSAVGREDPVARSSRLTSPDRAGATTTAKNKIGADPNARLRFAAPRSALPRARARVEAEKNNEKPSSW